MADTSDKQLLLDAGFERVRALLDYYDGPRAGVADLAGTAHYFRAVHDYPKPGVPDDEYLVWPMNKSILALEQEQSAIFTAWDTRRKAGTVGDDSYPGHGGIDARYDELEAQLAPHREVPAHARRVVAEWRPLAGPHGHAGGLGCLVRWSDGQGRR
jgi:hypothetical protein